MGLLATVGGTMFGFDISSMSAFLSQKYYLEFFNSPGSVQQGLITSSMAAGSFLGAIISSYISDRIGRRVTLFFSSLLWIIGAIIQCSCRNLGQLIVGRIIAGTGIGFSSSVAPMYCSEVSPVSYRGIIGGGYQLAITFGIMVMFYISFGCSYINGVGSFRLAWGLQMIPGIVLFVGVHFLPESPRWLANHGKLEEAVEILEKINKKEDKESFIKEVEELKISLEIFETSEQVTYFDIFRKKNIKSTMVCLSAQIWNQLTGFNAMMYYIVYIFKMVGNSLNSELVSSSIEYVIFFVVTLFSLPLTEKVGRRRLMLIGGSLMMSWLFIVGALFAVYSVPIESLSSETVNIIIPPNHKTIGKVIMACIYLFVATFASTWAVVSWVYCSEVVPSRTRSKVALLGTACNWAMNFALALYTPSAFKNISWKTYFIFGTFCGAMTINCFLTYPETKGRTLEEIDIIFQKGIPAWKTTLVILHDIDSFKDGIEETDVEKLEIIHIEKMP